MRVVMASIFRNSTGYLGRYFEQVGALAAALAENGHELVLRLAEGDSTDETPSALGHEGVKSGVPFDVIHVNHGGAAFGSVDHPTRWRNISQVCNTLLERIAQDEFDALIYVESDLIWAPETMLALLERVAGREPEGVDVACPMCFLQGGEQFYDIWGFRKDGVKFTPRAPYHAELDGLTEIDSAGSCLVMTAAVACLTRFLPPEEGIVGWGSDMRRHGFRLWCDPALMVYHP